MYIISNFNARIKAANSVTANAHYGHRIKNEKIVATAKAKREENEEVKETYYNVALCTITFVTMALAIYVLNAAMSVA